MKGFAEWARDTALGLWLDLKKWYTSSTLWFNAVGLPLLSEYWPQIWDAIPQLEVLLPEEKYHALFVIGLGVNLILRFKTTKALRHK